MNREEKKRLRHKKRREERRKVAATQTIPDPGVMGQATDQRHKKVLPQGLAMVKAAMDVYSKRGNPKDYVVLSEHQHIYDGERLYKVQATLPEKLEPGQPVYIVDTSKPEQPMREVVVQEDNGHELLLKGEHAEFVMDRGSVYPTRLPGRATPVHRSQLAQYVGERLALNWWKPGQGRARPQTKKKESV